MESIQEIIDAVQKQDTEEVATEAEWKKVKVGGVGDPNPGDTVTIIWGDKEDDSMVDHGYLLVLPICNEGDIWMSGLVHILSPDNPGGKDTPPPEWFTLAQLAANKDIQKIEIEEPK